MALKDVLTKPVKFRPANWYEVTVTQLDKEDREWLDACLADTANFSGVYIANKLTEAGYPVSSTTINNLRKTING
jgi:hypothetical protein